MKHFWGGGNVQDNRHRSWHQDRQQGISKEYPRNIHGISAEWFDTIIIFISRIISELFKFDGSNQRLCLRSRRRFEGEMIQVSAICKHQMIDWRAEPVGRLRNEVLFLVSTVPARLTDPIAHVLRSNHPFQLDDGSVVWLMRDGTTAKKWRVFWSAFARFGFGPAARRRWYVWCERTVAPIELNSGHISRWITSQWAIDNRRVEILEMIHWIGDE